MLLSRSGHRVVGVAGRERSRERAARHLPGVPFEAPAETARRGEVVIVGVPDDAIAPVTAELASQNAFGPAQAVLHLSGSTPLLALGQARAAGSTVLSLHPLQTFPDVDGGIERLPGSPMAVTAWDDEGNELGERLASDAGGRPFR
ncbi:MAG TPA: hypothetical protein VHH92_07290, partial [Actinomycetota bacterium]|nr:hypothetical protein [Actinomycetota bacterium]